MTCKGEALAERSDENMKLKHRIKINVLDPCQEKRTLLSGGDGSIRSRLLNKLLGGKVGVLVLVPDGGSISSVEIHEITGRGECVEAV